MKDSFNESPAFLLRQASNIASSSLDRRNFWLLLVADIWLMEHQRERQRHTIGPALIWDSQRSSTLLGFNPAPNKQQSA